MFSITFDKNKSMKPAGNAGTWTETFAEDPQLQNAFKRWMQKIRGSVADVVKGKKTELFLEPLLPTIKKKKIKMRRKHHNLRLRLHTKKLQGLLPRDTYPWQCQFRQRRHINFSLLTEAPRKQLVAFECWMPHRRTAPGVSTSYLKTMYGAARWKRCDFEQMLNTFQFIMLCNTNLGASEAQFDFHKLAHATCLTCNVLHHFCVECVTITVRASKAQFGFHKLFHRVFLTCNVLHSLCEFCALSEHW